MTLNHYSVAITPFILALAACSSDASKVDLGDDNRGTVAQSLAAYEGTWDGYAEARTFESGSDRVRITLDAEGNGTIELGDAPAIPPFTDPDSGYPTAWHAPGASVSVRDYVEPHEGFLYPVLEAAVTSGRLKFGFWTTDLVKDWCEAQAPTLLASTPPGYSCGESAECAPGNPSACGQYDTCMSACSCDATSCSSLRDASYKLQLDGALTGDGDTFEGTLLLPGLDLLNDFERVTVRLTR
jgi:hypothetical protein